MSAGRTTIRLGFPLEVRVGRLQSEERLDSCLVGVRVGSLRVVGSYFLLLGASFARRR